MADVSNIYHSVEEVADRFKVSPSAVYRLIKKGEIGFIRFGGQYRISELHITEYLNPKGDS